jgi:hypothetical protein
MTRTFALVGADPFGPYKARTSLVSVDPAMSSLLPALRSVL